MFCGEPDKNWQVLLVFDVVFKIAKEILLLN